ncbi:MAG: hypothetical protein ACK4Q5_07355 [Saprospiraceae bacterium]
MKIEIAESVIMSWLRHAKSCQIVQMNWKASGSWKFYNEVEVKKIIDESRKVFGENLFNKSSSIDQILKQGEIDVLGVEINENGVFNIYGVDVAFHIAGLNYGDTLDRVIKKMIRTAALITGYFDYKSAKIVFASPKVNNVDIEPLKKSTEKLNTLFRNNLSMDFDFEIIVNEDFRTKIFNPIMLLSKDVADTSELFMRSVQLSQLFEGNRGIGKIENHGKAAIFQTALKEEFVGYEEIRIGLLVRSTFTDLVKNGIISVSDIAELVNQDYCKTTFNLNYPFLKRIDSTKDRVKQRFEGVYPRYYVNPITIFSNDYYLCQEWFEQSKPLYLSWLNKVKRRSSPDSQNPT